MNPRVAILCCSLSLCACATRPLVCDVAQRQGDASMSGAQCTVTDSRPFAGIPFRVKQPHTVKIFSLTDEDSYVHSSTSTQVLANQDKLFTAGIDGQTFASATIRLQQNADNTLKVMSIASTDATADVLNAVAGTITGVEQAKNQAKTAQTASEKALTEAMKAVTEAQKAYDAAAADNKDVYLRILNSAKRTANSASQAAGQGLPFPDV